MKRLVWLTLALTLMAVASVRPAAAGDTEITGNSDTANDTATTASNGTTTSTGNAENSDQQSEGDARQALGRWLRFPWYDKASDDVTPVVIPERKRRADMDLPDLSIFQFLAWLVIALLLAGLIWLIVMALLNYTGGPASETIVPRVATRVDHVEALPFMRQRSLDDLLGQARQHYLAANYDEAIIYLFSYELVELDRRNLIRLASGKTNRQYLRELRGRGTLAGLVEQTMVAFEDVYFGGRRLTRQRFESAWDRLPEFESLTASFGPQLPALPVATTEPVSILAESIAGRD